MKASEFALVFRSLAGYLRTGTRGIQAFLGLNLPAFCWLFPRDQGGGEVSMETREITALHIFHLKNEVFLTIVPSIVSLLKGEIINPRRYLVETAVDTSPHSKRRCYLVSLLRELNHLQAVFETLLK